jgi:hypothetical protein
MVPLSSTIVLPRRAPADREHALSGLEEQRAQIVNDHGLRLTLAAGPDRCSAGPGVAAGPRRLSRPGGVAGRPGQAGCGTIRIYGFGSVQLPKISLAWSLETEPAMTTSSPCCQFTGVATLCLAVS